MIRREGKGEELSDTGEPKPPCGECDQVKLQFDYAWKWFSYHADQRTKMFNYMLIAMGIFATATVNAFNAGLLGVVVLLCLTSAVFAYSFSRLDKRNEELVRLGEEVLAHLERSALFAVPPQIQNRKGTPIDFGILRRQAITDASFPRTWQSDAWRGRHRFWLPALAKLIALLFVLAAGLVAYLIMTDP